MTKAERAHLDRVVYGDVVLLMTDAELRPEEAMAQVAADLRMTVPGVRHAVRREVERRQAAAQAARLADAAQARTEAIRNA
jgi:hypothetical protein